MQFLPRHHIPSTLGTTIVSWKFTREKSHRLDSTNIFRIRRHQKGAIEMQKIKSFDDLLKTIRTLCFRWEREHRKHHGKPPDCVSLSLSTPQERIRFCVASAKTFNAWPDQDQEVTFFPLFCATISDTHLGCRIKRNLWVRCATWGSLLLLSRLFTSCSWYRVRVRSWDPAISRDIN